MSSDASSPKSAVQTAAIAKRWSVTQRTVQRWVQRFGEDVVADEVRLSQQLLGDRKTPAAVRRVAAGIMASKALSTATAPTTSDVGADPVAAAGDLRARLTGLEAHLAWVDQQLKVAQHLKDQADVITWSRLYKELNAAVVANRLAQAKLGIDSGELIPRAELARLVYAMASRIGLGIQRVRDRLADRLVDLPTAEDVAQVLEPDLISELLLAPLARSANLAAGIGLPDWVVTEMTTAVADHIADGANELRAAMSAEATSKP